MAIKPILFSTEMVEAILEDRKTQTRRIKKGNKPQFQTGDILWVRETWDTFLVEDEESNTEIAYTFKAINHPFDRWVKWKPSIHMPKKAARIFLKVTNVRCERLQDISEEDAIAEGVRIIHDNKFKHYCPKKSFSKEELRNGTPITKTAICSFWTLWKAIYGEQKWNENPFVWVYKFKKIEKPKDFIL